MSTILSTAQFHGQDLTIIDHHGQKWLTAEQIGLALGYAATKARQGINNLYKRHEDEFTEQDKGVIELMTPGGRQRVTIFSQTGCHLLSFFSNTPRAKAFRAWAKQVLAGQTALSSAQPDTPATVNARLDRLESAVGMLAIHQRNTEQHMEALVQISVQQAQKLEVTGKYIGLLEINQKGKVRVTRKKEAQVLALRAQGMSQADIARLLRISTTAVSQIIHGKYPWAETEAALPTPSIEQALEELLETEGARVSKLLLKQAAKEGAQQ